MDLLYKKKKKKKKKNLRIEASRTNIQNVMFIEVWYTMFLHYFWLTVTFKQMFRASQITMKLLSNF